MGSYFTSANYAEFTVVEKKSEFIGACAPVKSESEALSFIADIRKKHSSAKHNVYAYVLREGFITRYSDDGEPHGTAGVPVLDTIKKAGLTDTAVVVTRYFGGILLGTGGLLRAYTAAATGAVKAAGVAEIGVFELFGMDMTYSDYRKIMPLLSALNAKTVDSVFTDNVFINIAVREEFVTRFLSELSESSGGRIIPQSLGKKCDFV